MRLPSFKTFSLTLFLLFSSLVCYSQVVSYIFDGYVITEKGEKMEGELSPESSAFKTVLHAVSFRKKSAYEFQEPYFPKDLKSVVLYTDRNKDTLIFNSKKVNVHLNKRYIKAVFPVFNPIWQDTTVFLRALVLGDMSLYQYSDDANNAYYFIEKKGKKVEALIDVNKQFMDDKKEKKLNYTYKLTELFKDCPPLKDIDFDKIHLNSSELMQIVVSYNRKMSRQASTYVVQQTQKTLYYGVTLGAHTTAVTQNGWAHTNKNITPSLGAWVRTDLLKKIPLRLFAEVEYAPFSTVSERYKNINLWQYFDSSAIKLDYVNANILLDYEIINNKTFKLYAKSGVSIGIVTANKTIETSYTKDDLFKTQYKIFKQAVRPWELGVTSAIGLQFNKLSVEARFRLSNGYSNTEMVKTKVNNISLNVFWALSKNPFYLKSKLKNQAY
jgi:hypothetical protein